MPVWLWDTDNEYDSMAAAPLELINDTAERGDREIQEYVNAAGDGGQTDVSFLFPVLTK